MLVFHTNVSQTNNNNIFTETPKLLAPTSCVREYRHFSNNCLLHNRQLLEALSWSVYGVYHENMAICRPQVLYRACSVGETSSIIKTLLGEIFITHGFSSLCGQTRGVERNPDSALSNSHVPPLWLGPSITALPSDSQSLSLRAQSPRKELSSGKHLTRDFRKLFREIVRKISTG